MAPVVVAIERFDPDETLRQRVRISRMDMAHISLSIFHLRTRNAYNDSNLERIRTPRRLQKKETTLSSGFLFLWKEMYM